MSNNSRVALATIVSVTGAAVLLYSLHRYLKQREPRSAPNSAGLSDETDSGPVVPNLIKYGKPSLLQEIKKPGYYILYNALTKTPVYVVEKLTRESLGEGVTLDRDGINFRSEESLKSMKSSNADYTGSGFDRGHMAAAANYTGNEDAVSETFTLGNVVPQFPACNRGNWKTIENHARALARKGAVVYVYSGPLYIPQHSAGAGEKYVIYRVIGDNTVAVPTHFFKILVTEPARVEPGESGNAPKKARKLGVEVTCYLVENSPNTQPKGEREMRVDLKHIEMWSGLLFEKLHKFL